MGGGDVNSFTHAEPSTVLVMAKPVREDFSESTKELLARRAGFRCSICDAPTVLPHSVAERSLYLGEASHIHSASPSGPRANPALTHEQRVSPDNGIHLCKVHARLIDVDVDQFTAEKLQQIKREHEDRIRSAVLPPPREYDADFLSTHETQVRHGRGSPSLHDLWVPRHVLEYRGRDPVKCDPLGLVRDLRGVLLVSGDQGSGRTSLLKRIAYENAGSHTCVWLEGRTVTETVFRDPIPSLAAGYRKLNLDEDGWHRFVSGPSSANLIILNDFHDSPLNYASRRRFLAFLQPLCRLVVVAVSEPTVGEFLRGPVADSLVLHHCELLDLSRRSCCELAEKWCRFRAELVPDHELDARVAATEDQLEILFGRKLMPRQPLFVLTALQLLDAGRPLDTMAGSFGGVYETVIHCALSHNAPDQAAISSERAYLEELAYWCEFERAPGDRGAFNQWFADRKAVRLRKVQDIENSLSLKGFLSPTHAGFRFQYQKYYFLASFLRDNPNRPGVQEFIAKLVSSCWHEDYANTALFLAYLQPSSSLISILEHEVFSHLGSSPIFDIAAWHLVDAFPKDFFAGLDFSTTDPEANRRQLAERVDQVAPPDDSRCLEPSFSVSTTEDNSVLDVIKGFHLIKLVGQLLRNSPVALDAHQKEALIRSGLTLGLRLANCLAEQCSPLALAPQLVASVRERVLKTASRTKIELELTGLACQLSQFIVFSVFKYSCTYLSHPDLVLIYRRFLPPATDIEPKDSYRVLDCGLSFELRDPDPRRLESVYRELPAIAQGFVRMWARIFLWFNRLPVTKRQALLSALEMGGHKQLLLPHG